MGSINKGSFKLDGVNNRSKVNTNAYNKSNVFTQQKGGNSFKNKFAFKGIIKNNKTEETNDKK